MVTPEALVSGRILADPSQDGSRNAPSRQSRSSRTRSSPLFVLSEGSDECQHRGRCSVAVRPHRKVPSRIPRRNNGAFPGHTCSLPSTLTAPCSRALVLRYST